MFSWFRSPAVCPLDAEKQAWTERRMRWLIEQFGLQRLRDATVVLPRPQFFPDPFSHRPEDAYPMFDRMCDYMGIRTTEVELQFYQEKQLFAQEGMQHGTAGLYVGQSAPFQVWVEVSNLIDPLSLAATMAHELAHVHLLGHGRISAEVEDHEPLTDLLTVFLGLGVITANSVIRQNSWHEGYQSGWSMRRSGYLTMPDFGYALALFAQARGESSPAWAQELRTDVHVPWKQGMRFLAETPDAWRREPS
jgi:hypothetical protein